MEKKIVKNSLYLLTSQIAVKFVAFFYTLFLARNLGVENFGLYTVALSYFSLLSIVSDFGINRYLVREVAIDKSKLPAILCVATFLRICLVAVAFAFFAIFLSALDGDSFRVSIILIAVLAIFPQAIALSLDSAYIATQKLFVSALGILILNLSNAVIGFFLIKEGFGVMGVASSLVLSHILYVLFLFFVPLRDGILYLKHNSHRHKVISSKIIKDISFGSLPYGVLGLLAILYFKIDTLLLSYMKGPYETGLYAASYKFLEAIIFVPSAVSTAIFPVLARLHTHNILEVEKLYYKSLAYLFGISGLILLAYLTILPLIIRAFLPAYLESIESLKILSFAIPFMFIHTPAVLVLLSTERFLKPVIYLSVLMLFLNITLNLYFIPKFGYIGAAMVTVLSEVLSFFTFFILLRLKVFRN